jgi:hypothetical protein
MVNRTAYARAGARGAIAAMAMSGLRQLTTSLGIVEKAPPESVLQRTAPGLFNRVPVDRRTALVEVMHWSYGLAGGVLFGALPSEVRRHRWAGPAYGTLFWALFVAGIAPALGLTKRHNGVGERLALLADHVLYGVVVAASPWPHED